MVATTTPTVPTTKAELLAHNDAQWRALVAFTDALSEAEWTGPTDAAGWSVKDHVAHLVSWVRADIALLLHRTPLHQAAGIPDAVSKTGDQAQINEVVRQQTFAEAPAAVRAERDRVFRKLVKVVSVLTGADLERPATDFGLDEQGKSLLTVLTEYHGDHFAEHRRYIEIIVAQG